MPPDQSALAHNHQAIALAQQGQLDAAVQCFLQGLELAPDHILLLNNLAGLLCQAERFDQALAVSRRAAAAWPNLPDAHNHLGNALCGLKQYDPAIAEFQSALSLRPDFADAHNNLARAYRKNGQTAAAIHHYIQALALRPASPDFLHNLAEAFCHDRQFLPALDCCRRALALNPNDPHALDLLGTAFRGLGDLTQSIAAHRAAVAINPQSALFENNLGIALHLNGDLSEAIARHRRALQLAPDFPLAHLNLGLALLTQGDFQNGWPEYEWRLRSDEFRLITTLTQPPWDGSDLAGRRILIHTEQGFGDAIQFFRFLPLVAERHGRIILACQRQLHRLFHSSPLVQQLIAPDEIIPPHDVQCPLMSLPRIFRTTLASIPSDPYLAADPALAARWQTRLPLDARVKIGFVWANQPSPPDRCPAPVAFGPLANLTGLWFCSLQKEKHLSPPPGLPLTDYTDELTDFADTASLISHLDLILTVNTAVAHLAAAMAKPVWLLLRFIPDWRWLLDRGDSPWYPTLRLFRQPRSGDWQTPIAQIAQRLILNS